MGDGAGAGSGAGAVRRGILVLDFGSQYTQLIVRRVRELGVYCEIHPWCNARTALAGMQCTGVILSGGPESVTSAGAPGLDEAVLAAGVPVLGICYGLQLICSAFGGGVRGGDAGEFGPAMLEITDAGSALFAGVEGAEQSVWMSHGDHVESLPEGFASIARSAGSPNAAVADVRRCIYGLQFHPEVDHTPCGREVLRAFVEDVCSSERNWTAEDIIDGILADIRRRVGTERVLMGVSGGVDSTVAAMLLHRAIGEQLQCVFVDNGLLRLGEGDRVMQVFAEQGGVRVRRVDAGERFLAALAGLDEPEAKRKAIGEVFVRVFDEAAGALGEFKFLGQGTIYSDVIESGAASAGAGTGAGAAKVIKSHHNVGGLPEDMRFELVEPLRTLFKDEARMIGRSLGVPEHLIGQHPFPGPSLAVRVLGEVREEYLEVLRRADAIYIEELRASGWYEKLSQAFAVFLPVKAVGVVGDARRYAWTIVLRAVETQDFMTAHWSHLPHDLLDQIGTRILNEIEDVARVVYDISNKPPATIEWE